MKISTPLNRGLLLWAIMFVLLTQIFWSWFSLRFLHYEASYRSLAPEHYKVQVITPEDYRRLADPANLDVTLSNGHRIRDRSPAWYKLILPKYKLTEDGHHYVLVTTKGTAHMLPAIEGYLILFGFLTACGVAVSFWNLARTGKEALAKAPSPPSS